MNDQERSLRDALSNIPDDECYELDNLLVDYNYENKKIQLRAETVTYLKALDSLIIAMRRDIDETEKKMSEAENIEKKRHFTEKIIGYTTPVFELNCKLKNYMEELNEYDQNHENDTKYRSWQSDCREAHRQVLAEIQKIRQLVRTSCM